MAVKNSVTLTAESGLTIPADNIIVPTVRFPKATLNLDANGNWDGTITRVVEYDLYVYLSVTSLQALDTFIQGGVKEFPSGYSKVMTPQEYADLLANGTLAEIWLKDYIQGVIGGTSTIIDPYV